MRPRQYTLTPTHVQTHTTSRLQKHLRLADHGRKCTAATLGTVLCYAASRKRSGWAEYTMTNAAKRRARFRVCIKCRNRRGERGRHGRQALVDAFGGPLRPSSYTWVKETYRGRFAIETS